jgi:hypothetical protein
MCAFQFQNDKEEQHTILKAIVETLSNLNFTFIKHSSFPMLPSDYIRNMYTLVFNNW